MARYRKKPVVVEARLFRAYTEGPELIGWMEESGTLARMAGSWDNLSDPGPAYILIDPLGTERRADVGDFIFKGESGFYPMEHEVFLNLYEEEGENKCG
jgi:hypothetical protein